MKRGYGTSAGRRSFGLGVRFEMLEGRQLLAAALPSNGSDVITMYHAPRSAAVLASPSINRTDPANGATNVLRNTSVIAYPNLPNTNGVIDPASLSSSTVYLYKTSDTTKTHISANVNTSGGGDTLVLTPTTYLASNTKYTYVVTSGVKDTDGAGFTPFTMSFTTGTNGGPISSNIAFTKTLLSTAQGRQFTSINMGPDGRIYCGTMTGEIIRFSINADGTLSQPYVINTVKNHEGGVAREVIGIAFDPASTATNLIAWVTHNYGQQFGAPNRTGKLSKLWGPNLENIRDEAVKLPRSFRDHMLLKDVFGPDGKLYFCSGAMTGMGAPDAFWGNLPEEELAGVILQVDTKALDAYVSAHGPLDARTKDVGGTYDPFAAGAPMKIYAQGVRNSYDLLFHSNGTLYSAVNGSAPGENTPAGPGVPALTDVQQNEPDWVFKIHQGGYYGHPNPVLGHYVLNGGNPTSGPDLFQVDAYPIGIKPDPKWQPAVYKVGNNYSPDGMIEYESNAFGGALKHSILITRYSAGDDVMVMTPDANGNFPTGSVKTGITGLTGLKDPVDLLETPNNGNLYIVEFAAQRISLFRPSSGGTSGGTGSFSDFELINADTNKDVSTLQSGSTINFATLGTKNINIRADVSGTAGSVRFGIDSNSNFRTESSKPYALAGDSGNGDYYAWTPSLGTHTFTATLYSGSGATGTVLDTKSFTFTVTDGSGGGGSGTSFADFELINADTNKDVSLFQSGSVIDFSKLGTKNVNIRADVSGSAGSVRFGIDSNSNFRTENNKPYALAGDSGTGDYFAWTPSVGTHTFTATIYSGANGTGSVLATKSFTFTVTSGTVSGTGVKSFSLVNADTGALLRTVTDGSTIDFNTLSTKHVAVRADVSGTAGSVKFGYDSNSSFRIEGKAPYALNGDAGDGIHYTVWTPTDGSHTLTATAYSGSGATGSMLGSPLTVHITILNA